MLAALKKHSLSPAKDGAFTLKTGSIIPKFTLLLLFGTVIARAIEEQRLSLHLLSPDRLLLSSHSRLFPLKRL